MTEQDPSTYKEIVATFSKRKDLALSIKALIKLGVNKYDIDVLSPMTELAPSSRDGSFVVWICVQDLVLQDRILSILRSHSAADIHTQDLLDDRDDDPYGKEKDAYMGDVDKSKITRYENENIVKQSPVEFYVHGKVFPTLELAKSYIDKLASLDRVYANARENAYNLQAALKNPADVFASPGDLLRSHFPKDRKIELLKRWADDVVQQEVADDEGMFAPGDSDILADIQDALIALEQD